MSKTIKMNFFSDLAFRILHHPILFQGIASRGNRSGHNFSVCKTKVGYSVLMISWQRRFFETYTFRKFDFSSYTECVHFINRSLQLLQLRFHDMYCDSVPELWVEYCNGLNKE